MQLRQTTLTQINGVLGASMAVTGRAMAGNLRVIAVGLYEEFDE